MARKQESVFFDPFTEHEIISSFIDLKNGTFKNVNEFQIKPVKFVFVLIASLFAQIFNLALEFGEFPRRTANNDTS